MIEGQAKCRSCKGSGRSKLKLHAGLGVECGTCGGTGRICKTAPLENEARVRLQRTGSPALAWSAEVPGVGLWWHTTSRARYARPHEVNLCRDGVLRSGSRTCRDGYFVSAASLGGWWWPVKIEPPIVEPPGNEKLCD